MNTKIGRSSCTSILIGKKASLTGSVVIGRNEDAKTAWPKHLAFNAHKIIQNNHFKSKDNKFEMDLPKERFSYSSTPEWTDKYGVFEEDGINEYHVAMSATESAYANERVLAADPFETEKGILEACYLSMDVYNFKELLYFFITFDFFRLGIRCFFRLLKRFLKGADPIYYIC